VRKVLLLVGVAVLGSVMAVLGSSMEEGREARAAGDPVLLGAGDIASCGSQGDEATARLLDDRRGRVITLGDNAYPDGTLAQFRNCYGPSWGRHKARTRPSAGNHEYNTPQAAG
jgi:acid phosphatase type 7